MDDELREWMNGIIEDTMRKAKELGEVESEKWIRYWGEILGEDSKDLHMRIEILRKLNPALAKDLLSSVIVSLLINLTSDINEAFVYESEVRQLLIQADSGIIGKEMPMYRFIPSQYQIQGSDISIRAIGDKWAIYKGEVVLDKGLEFHKAIESGIEVAKDGKGK